MRNLLVPRRDKGAWHCQGLVMVIPLRINVNLKSLTMNELKAPTQDPLPSAVCRVLC